MRTQKEWEKQAKKMHNKWKVQIQQGKIQNGILGTIIIVYISITWKSKDKILQPNFFESPATCC